MLAFKPKSSSGAFRLKASGEVFFQDNIVSGFRISEGSAAIPAPGGGVVSVVSGDLLLVHGDAKAGDFCVMTPWGHGCPRLGRVTSSGLVAEPSGVSCSSDRWHSVGRLVGHIRRNSDERGRVVDMFNRRGTSIVDQRISLVVSGRMGGVDVLPVSHIGGDVGVRATVSLANKGLNLSKVKAVVGCDIEVARMALELVGPGELLLLSPNSSRELSKLLGSPRVNRQLDLFG
jgi:hypothetical protein